MRSTSRRKVGSSATSPPGVSLEVDQQANSTEELSAMFADSRWVPIDPPESLDNEGAELVLIGGQDDLGEDLGIDPKSHRFGAM
jgi:hypothetical protein